MTTGFGPFELPRINRQGCGQEDRNRRTKIGREGQEQGEMDSDRETRTGRVKQEKERKQEIKRVTHTEDRDRDERLAGTRINRQGCGQEDRDRDKVRYRGTGTMTDGQG